MLDFLEVDRAFLAENEARILDLETQIAGLEHTISVLRAARQPVQDRVDSYKYPVLTLPNEIVAEIFIRFLPTYPSPHPLTGTHSPTCLTHVCRQWREIAHTTPALWRVIDLTRPTEQYNAEKIAALVNLWSGRSGCCPMAVHLTDGNEPRSVFPAVIHHRARWEHLTLDLNTTEYLDAIQGSFPSLKTLTVHFSSLVRDAPVVSFQDLPLLHTALLNDLHMVHIILPWSQLTSLVLMCINSEHCMSVLQQTSQLVRCELHLWRPQKDLTEGSVHLLHLETLAFQMDTFIDVKFFRSFVTPALLYLRLPEALLGPDASFES
ncbi:F-box domain-containing protein [Favolaschia claudopus]|uniref:F-box domain-containing protein n=1 Tax=Favolaschia claudopus TaxID=2862362 RepID=A0AAV9ZCL1_9AGAR